MRSSGAVSLIEIAIATSRPVTIPGSAAFSTILRSVQVERQAEGLGAISVGAGHLGQRRFRRLGEYGMAITEITSTAGSRPKLPVQAHDQRDETDVAEHDRRDAGQHLVAAAQDPAVPAGGELGEVDAGQHADGATDDQDPGGDVERAEDGLLQAAAGAGGVGGQHAPLPVRHGFDDDAARQPDQRHDDRGQADEATAPEDRVPDFLPTGTSASRDESCRAAFSDPGGETDDEAVPMLSMRVIGYRPLPTGSAVPDTRRTISRATTLVASVMTSSTRASSA